MDLEGKSLQEYPVNASVPQSSIVGPTLFLLHIAISANKTTIYFKCDKASHLLKELELACDFNLTYKTL